MTVTLIQEKVTANSLGSGTRVATFDTGTTAGSTIGLVIVGAGGLPAINTITDDGGNTYARVTRSRRLNTQNGYASIFAQVAYAKHATAGTTTVTVVLTDGSHFHLGIYEIEESEVRLFLNANGTGGAASPAVGPITPGTANSFNLAGFALDNNIGLASGGTPGTGWTGSINAGGGWAGYLSEYRALSSATAITADGVFSIGGLVLEWAGTLVSFTSILPVPVNTVPAAITGQASSAKTLTATPGTWTDEDSRTAIWQRSATADFETPIDIAGTDDALTYLLDADDDLGFYIRYFETSTNGFGDEFQPSNVLGPVGTSVGDLIFRFEFQTDMSVELPAVFALIVPAYPGRGNTLTAEPIT